MSTSTPNGSKYNRRKVFKPLKRGRACMNCRFLKIKCDGERPICGPCRRHPRDDECEYMEYVGGVWTKVLENTMSRPQPSQAKEDSPHAATQSLLPSLFRGLQKADSSSKIKDKSPLSFPLKWARKSKRGKDINVPQTIATPSPSVSLGNSPKNSFTFLPACSSSSSSYGSSYRSRSSMGSISGGPDRSFPYTIHDPWFSSELSCRECNLDFQTAEEKKAHMCLQSTNLPAHRK